jgi:hypothetical protein
MELVLALSKSVSGITGCRIHSHYLVELGFEMSKSDFDITGCGIYSPFQGRRL